MPAKIWRTRPEVILNCGKKFGRQIYDQTRWILERDAPEKKTEEYTDHSQDNSQQETQSNGDIFGQKGVEMFIEQTNDFHKIAD